ncbi:NUDIX hydrolase [Phaeobacter sp.]|uniref:NUDIX hydrolase n=1 Tax=Phaeobacter sp. TaxID=1902409 RepID=UPI0025DCCDC2|nr:NUDIX hydrolase [Phaeobacter sp.]
MKPVLSSAWEEFLRPLFFRPKALQVAALCYRAGTAGTEVLMITSRGTGRWIIPKGWPIKGKNSPQSALQEAWEEAGVKSADIEDTPTGSYTYIKTRKNGIRERVETLVYKALVSELSDEYPESHQRKRVWMPATEAAELVAEPELSALLRQV